jgi:hypothetical protein
VINTGAVQTVGPVQFDYSWWQQRYPDLARWCSPGMAQGYFDLATLYLDNTDAGAPPTQVPGFGFVGCRYGGSPVTNIAQRQILLGLLTAHIATLNAPLNGQPASGLVGRISSATEGSVSVSVDMPEIAGAEWYTQTKYGMAYWTATARYRRGGRYFSGPGARVGGGIGYTFSRGGRGF